MADDVFGIVGTVQGDAFRVDAVVAEGGFAVVYRAYHAAFRADVALKCLKVPGAMSKEGQQDFLEKFREEAELLFHLSSAIPAVVRPLHVGTISHKDNRFVPFIALEWLEGYTLDRLISTRAIEGAPPLDMKAATKLLTPVADALSRAHKFPTPQGVVSIVHRDLKPENIFIAKIHGREQTKILDFGIAKAKSAATQLVGQLSANESPLSAFTPAYGAPEQWVPKRYGQSGPWTDVWGLALTVVETVCGHCPIDGDHPAMMGSAIDSVRRPTPRNEGVTVSDEVEAIFTQALAVDPRDRFHEIAAFWNALCRAVSLPEISVDASPSVPPPAAGSSSSSAAHTQGEGQRTDIASSTPSQVPDLVVSPSSRGGAPRSGRPPSQKPAAVRAKAPSKDPNALFGSSFELDDSSSAPLKLDTERDFGLTPTSVPARRMGTSAYAPRRSEPKLRLGAPLTLFALAIALMGLDWAYAASMGEVLRVGPARMFWVAGPLAVLGAIQLLSRLLALGD
jgi:serine/threonine-protein kinase